MTIAKTHKEIQEIIKQHKVYGAEVILNALVNACKDNPYLQEENLIDLLKRAEARSRGEYED